MVGCYDLIHWTAAMKANNLVAKHAHRYNRAAVHTDRKKAAKSGYTKHKALLYGYA